MRVNPICLRSDVLINMYYEIHVLFMVMCSCCSTALFLLCIVFLRRKKRSEMDSIRTTQLKREVAVTKVMALSAVVIFGTFSAPLTYNVANVLPNASKFSIPINSWMVHPICLTVELFLLGVIDRTLRKGMLTTLNKVFKCENWVDGFLRPQNVITTTTDPNVCPFAATRQSTK
uniref:G-protein coupled receptors family 1 profile domain-containing protein n=1 Tax=Trichuris muris TaxID=70415 RepID=A0A5S6R5G6_TRIMR